MGGISANDVASESKRIGRRVRSGMRRSMKNWGRSLVAFQGVPRDSEVVSEDQAVS